MDIPSPRPRRQRRAAGATDAGLLKAEIARLRAANAELTSALAEMEQVALRDPLTGLYNRRYFLSALQDRIAHVARYGARIAILYVDVDGLKAINDRLGHGAGDAALGAIADCLRAAIRESDIIARIGGDEFALLIDHVDAPAARTKMRKLQQSLGALSFTHDGEALRLSAAFGMAMIDPRDSAEALLGRADSDMYRAKQADSDWSGRPPGA
jgi:diguanylate cyclase (GGDEF)-like protein